MCFVLFIDMMYIVYIYKGYIILITCYCYHLGWFIISVEDCHILFIIQFLLFICFFNVFRYILELASNDCTFQFIIHVTTTDMRLKIIQFLLFICFFNVFRYILELDSNDCTFQFIIHVTTTDMRLKIITSIEHAQNTPMDPFPVGKYILAQTRTRDADTGR